MQARVYLSHRRFKQYVGELQRLGLADASGRPTQQGEEFLRRYRALMELLPPA